MPGYVGKTTNLSREVVGAQAQAEREDQWGEIPGEVVSFNPSAQTATIQPLYKPRHNGKAVDMPQLLEVPVRFARAGGGAITYPIKAGDKVTLRPKMRSTENYHTDGDGEASDARSFNLSDMEAHLDGGESLTDPIPNFDPDNVNVRFDPAGNYGIKGSAAGKIQIEGSEGNVYALLAQAIRLIGDDQLQIAYGSSAGSGHALSNKAQILAIADKLDAMAL